MEQVEVLTAQLQVIEQHAVDAPFAPPSSLTTAVPPTPHI